MNLSVLVLPSKVRIMAKHAFIFILLIGNTCLRAFVITISERVLLTYLLFIVSVEFRIGSASVLFLYFQQPVQLSNIFNSNFPVFTVPLTLSSMFEVFQVQILRVLVPVDKTFVIENEWIEMLNFLALGTLLPRRS
jgi:hypothetical protein